MKSSKNTTNPSSALADDSTAAADVSKDDGPFRQGWGLGLRCGAASFNSRAGRPNRVDARLPAADRYSELAVMLMALSVSVPRAAPHPQRT